MIALAALARGEAMLLIPLLAVPWILLTRIAAPRRARVRHLVVTVVACVAVLAPWMIRNATTFEKFVPLSTNGNEVMVYANCPSAYNGPFVGYWDFQCQQRVREAQGDPPGDESQTALYWRSLGFNYARDHVGELPRVVTLRVLRQWELFRPLQNVRLAGIEGRNQRRQHDGIVDVLRPGRLVDRRRRLDAATADPAVADRRAVPRRHHHCRPTRTAPCDSARPPSRRCACWARSVSYRSLPWRVAGWHVGRRARRARKPTVHRSCSVAPVVCGRGSAARGNAVRSRRGQPSDRCWH